MLAVRMQTGLHKLVEAAAAVEILKTELIEKNKVIVVASAAAEEVLKEVKVSADAAEIVKAEVSKIKSAAETLVAQITIDTEIAQGKLKEAEPALNEATAALNVSKFVSGFCFCFCILISFRSLLDRKTV